MLCSFREHKKKSKTKKKSETKRASNEAQIAETIPKRCLDVNTISQDSLGCPKECIIVVVVRLLSRYFPAANGPTFAHARARNLNDSSIYLLAGSLNSSSVYLSISIY